jgi:hypothetical protein
LKISNNKAIFTGSYREFYTYQNPYVFAWKSKKKHINSIKPEKKEKTKEDYEKYALSASFRARSKIKRLIFGNQYIYPEKPTFLTLTFKDNVTNIKLANKHFTNFIKRMSRRIGKQMRYVAVHEFQKRGALHYHAIVFNLPYIEAKEIAKIWRHGMIDIEIVKSQGLPFYMTKYITKSFMDERCKGAKRYFYSLEHHSRLERSNLRCLYEKTKMKPEYQIGQPKTYIFIDNRGVLNSVHKSEYLVGGVPPDVYGGGAPAT